MEDRMRSAAQDRSRALTRAFTVVATGCFLWAGCGNDDSLTSAPDRSKAGPVSTVLDMANPRVQEIAAVQLQHTPELLAMPSVIGTAVGQTKGGQLAIMVYTEEPTDRLPLTSDGIPVEQEVTGTIHAMAVADHQVKQTPPVQLGTSGGWRFDLANGFCCGGTLGSLVHIGATQYVLSNYHVLEADIVSGGNGRVAQNGDGVVQPGLIDVGCNAANAQNVATLHLVHSLPGSNVDCALGQVIAGQVRTDGSILEVGTISATTVGASIGQAVKKSGRTTGLSRSSVNGLNATVSVAYDNECAGGAAFTKTFTGQIVIRNRGSKFLNSGDSGSLMVEDVTTNPRAVGLLFAGGSGSAIANPIGQVLSFLGATMVGN